MARRRSPDEVLMSVSSTGLLMLMPSAWAIWDSLRDADSVSKGVKRNLEQRDASGSIIL